MRHEITKIDEGMYKRQVAGQAQRLAVALIVVVVVVLLAAKIWGK